MKLEEILNETSNNNSNIDLENIGKPVTIAYVDAMERISHLEYIIYSIIKNLIEMEDYVKFDFRSFVKHIEENTDVSNLEAEYFAIKNKYREHAIDNLFQDDVIDNLSKNDISMVIDILKDELKKEA